MTTAASRQDTPKRKKKKNRKKQNERLMGRLRNVTEFCIVVIFNKICRLLPEKSVYALLRCLSCFFYYGLRERRKIAYDNIRTAFPDAPPEEQRRIIKQTFQHMGTVIAESLLLLAGKLDRDKLNQRIDGSDITGFRELEQANENGILVITGHIGNWELFANYAALHSHNDLCVIGRETNNPLIEKHFVAPLRTHFGNRLIHKKKALLATIKALRRGNNIGMLIDQKTNAKSGLPVRFFGQETQAVTSPAILHLKYNIPVVPGFLIRKEDGDYTLILDDPVTSPPESLSYDEKVAWLTQRYQQIIEDKIRKHPEQWLWMHNRWRRKH